MALNFPIPTSVGQVYQDPTSGNTYVCTSLGPPAQWVGSGSSTSLDGTYLRKDASNDPVTGNLLLNPTTNVSPLTLQQPVGNTTPALKIENSGSGNSIEANGFAVSETGVLTLGTALAIASGGTGATTQSAARTNLGATTVGNAVFTAVDEAAARTAIGAASRNSILAAYNFATWNPANLAFAETPAPSTGTQIDNDYVTFSNVGGLLTITLDVAGSYFFSVCAGSYHGAQFSAARIRVLISGTAISGYSFDNNALPSWNMSSTFSFSADVTAGQTVTVYPTYEVTGNAPASKHTALCLVNILYCGS